MPEYDRMLFCVRRIRSKKNHIYVLSGSLIRGLFCIFNKEKSEISANMPALYRFCIRYVLMRFVLFLQADSHEGKDV